MTKLDKALKLVRDEGRFAAIAVSNLCNALTPLLDPLVEPQKDSAEIPKVESR